MPTRVLVVDDEAEVRTAVRRGLELMGYEIEVASDGFEGVTKVDSWRPDVVLLDLAMPKMGGLTVIAEIRAWSKVPIIVLSVMGEEGDKVRALEAGADDYLTKPFGLQELHARIRVALRHAGSQSMLQFGDVRLDIDRRVVTVRGEEVHLTPIEYELFKELASASGRVLGSPPAPVEPGLGAAVRDRSELPAARHYVVTQETGHAPDQDGAGRRLPASRVTRTS